MRRLESFVRLAGRFFFQRRKTVRAPSLSLCGYVAHQIGRGIRTTEGFEDSEELGDEIGSGESAFGAYDTLRGDFTNPKLTDSAWTGSVSSSSH
jgi:hypothetical protein